MDPTLAQLVQQIFELSQALRAARERLAQLERSALATTPPESGAS